MIPLALISRHNAHGVFEDSGPETQILLENVRSWKLFMRRSILSASGARIGSRRSPTFSVHRMR